MVELIFLWPECQTWVKRTRTSSAGHSIINSCLVKRLQEGPTQWEWHSNGWHCTPSILTVESLFYISVACLTLSLDFAVLLGAFLSVESTLPFLLFGVALTVSSSPDGVAGHWQVLSSNTVKFMPRFKQSRSLIRSSEKCTFLRINVALDWPQWSATARAGP